MNNSSMIMINGSEMMGMNGKKSKMKMSKMKDDKMMKDK